MVYCNLTVLLAERQLKISKMSADTGISRTTLTAICQNHGKGIQMDTVNKLCMYLDITVGDLYTFFPFDIAPHSISYDSKTETAQIEFVYRSKMKHVERLRCWADVTLSDTFYNGSIELNEYEEDDDDVKRENAILREVFHILPIPEINLFKKYIAEQVIDGYLTNYNWNVPPEDRKPFEPEYWDVNVNLPSNWTK